MIADHFQVLVRYNAWANHRLYDACQLLSEQELNKSRPSLYGTIPGTLNHVLASDRMWLARIRSEESSHIDTEQVIHEDLATLWAARQVEDDKLITAIDSIQNTRLGGMLFYTSNVGKGMQTPLPFVVSHMLYHQTHHRGQVHAMLSQTEVEPPALDLILFSRENWATW